METFIVDLLEVRMVIKMEAQEERLTHIETHLVGLLDMLVVELETLEEQEKILLLDKQQEEIG